MGAVFDVRTSGAVAASQLLGKTPRKLRAVDLETELSDGSFVTTSDATQAAKASEFTDISRVFLPQGTPPAQLLAAHREHLQQILAAKPGVSPVVVRSFDELRESQNRLHMLKSQHRSSPAYNLADQISRISGEPLNAAQQEMADEAAAMHSRRMSGS